MKILRYFLVFLLCSCSVSPTEHEKAEKTCENFGGLIRAASYADGVHATCADDIEIIFKESKK